MNISSIHPTQTLLTILLSMDLITLQGVSLRSNSHQRETIYNKLGFFAKLVRQCKSNEWEKIWYKTNLYFSFTPIYILKSLVKTKSFECRYCLFTRKGTKSKSWSRVLWNLLLLMKQSYVLQVVHFNIRKRQKKKLELINLKCVTVTYAQPIFCP